MTPDDVLNSAIDPVKPQSIRIATIAPNNNFIVNCAAQAAHNARETMSDKAWQEKRLSTGNPVRADILMAFDPRGEKEGG